MQNNQPPYGPGGPGQPIYFAPAPQDHQAQYIAYPQGPPQGQGYVAPYNLVPPRKSELSWFTSSSHFASLLLRLNATFLYFDVTRVSPFQLLSNLTDNIVESQAPPTIPPQSNLATAPQYGFSPQAPQAYYQQPGYGQVQYNAPSSFYAPQSYNATQNYNPSCKINQSCKINPSCNINQSRKIITFRRVITLRKFTTLRKIATLRRINPLRKITMLHKIKPFRKVITLRKITAFYRIKPLRNTTTLRKIIPPRNISATRKARVYYLATTTTTRKARVWYLATTTRKAWV